MTVDTLCKIFIFIGSMIVMLGFYFYLATTNFMRAAVEVEGRVIQVERDASMYRPVVEYTDHNATTKIFTSSVSTSYSGYTTGDNVKVLFIADSSGFASAPRIKSGFRLWFATVFCIVFGSLFALIAGLALYVNSKGGVVYFDGTEYQGEDV